MSIFKLEDRYGIEEDALITHEKDYTYTEFVSIVRVARFGLGQNYTMSEIIRILTNDYNFKLVESVSV